MITSPGNTEAWRPFPVERDKSSFRFKSMPLALGRETHSPAKDTTVVRMRSRRGLIFRKSILAYPKMAIPERPQ